MAVDIGARIKVDGEAAYNQQISQIIKLQKELKADMQATEAAFRADDSAKKKSAETTKQLERQLTTANEKLRLQSEELKKLEASGQGASKQADNLRLGIARTEAEIAKLNKELRQNSGMVAFGKDMQATGEKLQKFGGGMEKFGSTMTKSVTAPLAAAGAMAVKLATEFETSMAKLNSIADTSEKSLDTLRKEVMALSDQTGISASDIAEQTYQAISAGQSTANAVKFVSETTKLARAGFAETGAALDVLTTIMNAYGKSASETTKVSDILVTTQNLGKTTVAQLSENMGQAIPTAAAYAADLENVASAYVTLTKQGVNTANATTQINGLMNDLGKAGTKASTALKEKTGKTFKELMNSGASLSDVLKIVKEAADDNGLALNDMFGNIRAGRAAMAIMNDEGVTFSETLVSMGKAAGATETAFQKVTDTTAYKFEVALNKVKNTGIEAGQQLLITFAPAIEKVGEGITKAVTSFSEMSKSEQQALIKTLAFAAGIGPATMALGKLTTGIGTVTKGAGELIEKWGLMGKVPASGIVGIAGGFVALSAALAKASYNAEKYAGETGKVVRESEKASDAAKELSGSIEASSSAYADNNAKIDDNAKHANKLVDELDELSGKTNRTAEENARMATAVETLNSIYPGLGLTIDANTGKLSQNTKELRANVESLGEQAKAIAAQERAVEINKQLMDVESQLAKLKEQEAEATKTAADAYETYAKNMEMGLTNGEVAYTEASIAAKNLGDEISDLEQKQKDLNGELKSAESYLGEHEDALNETGEAANEAGESVAALAEEMESEAQAAQEAAEKIAEGARIQANAFDEVKEAQTKSIEEIIQGLRSQVTAQANYRKNLHTLQQYVAKDANSDWSEIIRIFQEGGASMAGELQGVVDAIEAGDTAALKEMAALAIGMEQEVNKAGRELNQLSEKTKGAMSDTTRAILTAKPKILSEAKAAAQGIGTSWKAGTDASKKTMYTDTASAMDGAKKGITDKKPEIEKVSKQTGESTGTNYAAGARSKKGEAEAASGEVASSGAQGLNNKKSTLVSTGTAVGAAGGQAAVDAMRGKRRAAEEAGEYISLGLAQGLKNKQSDTDAAARGVAQSAVNQMKAVPKISSPSKVTTEIGEFLDEGLIVGMMNRIAAVKAMAAEVARAALPNVGNTMLDITGQVGLDPDEMYAAVREGASDATQNIYLNGRDLTRGLRGLGVSFNG